MVIFHFDNWAAFSIKQIFFYMNGIKISVKIPFLYEVKSRMIIANHNVPMQVVKMIKKKQLWSLSCSVRCRTAVPDSVGQQVRISLSEGAY